MAANRHKLGAEVVRTAVELHRRGWVANHDGNVTARVGADRFVATPTATSKANVDERGLLEVDGSGKKLAGQSRAFGELPVHLAVYRRRADVGAVIHAHPPHATALACSGNNLIERPFIAEAVVSIGARIPLLPYAAPGAPTADLVAGVASEVDAVLLQNHGVFSWGATLEQALLRLELVEHLARIAILAQATGGVRPLPADALPALLASRARAGLGAAADRAADSSKPVVACAPAPHAAVATVAPGGAKDDLAAIVRDEIVKALADG